MVARRGPSFVREFLGRATVCPLSVNIVRLSFVREYCPSVPLSAAFSLVPILRPRLSLVCPVALSEKPVKA